MADRVNAPVHAVQSSRARTLRYRRGIETYRAELGDADQAVLALGESLERALWGCRRGTSL